MNASPADLLARRQAGKALALIRLVAPPVIFVGERLVDHPLEASGPFEPILVAAAAYALLVFAVTHLRDDVGLPTWLYASLDLAFVCALTYTSGGPFSELRYAFFLLPLGAALLARPMTTLAVSIASILAYLAISLAHPAGSRLSLVEFEAAQAAYLAWGGVAATLLSHLLWQRAERIEALAESRKRLVAQVLAAEDRERRRLAEALHDEAIQNLLAARQELAAGNLTDTDMGLVRAGLEQTIAQLRDAVFTLHPYLLEHGGLAAAISAVVDKQARRAGVRVAVDIDRAATGVHDQLVFSVARELVANAVKHAEAHSLEVTLRRNGDAIRLEVSDDGRGLAPGRQAEALRSGHIGLASCLERVEAVGGSFEIASRPGGGTTARARLPWSTAQESASPIRS